LRPGPDRSGFKVILALERLQWHCRHDILAADSGVLWEWVEPTFLLAGLWARAEGSYVE
jgi:hypothetical protein